jgi:hypothetical protein
VQIIAVDELGPQGIGHLEADAGLAAATHTHHDNALARHYLTLSLFKNVRLMGSVTTLPVTCYR